MCQLEVPSICANVSPFHSVFCFSQIWSVNWRKEKRKEAKKRGWKSSQSQHFLSVLDPFSSRFYRKSFPFTESLGSCISLAPAQMVSADLCKDAARNRFCFQLYCRSTARKRKLCIQHVEPIWGACGIPQGSSALTRPNAGPRHGP